MCCLQLTGGQGAANTATFRAGLLAKLHVSQTAPVPELIPSLLPHPGVQEAVPVLLAPHYCQRELCLHPWQPREDAAEVHLAPGVGGRQQLSAVRTMGCSSVGLRGFAWMRSGTSAVGCTQTYG